MRVLKTLQKVFSLNKEPIKAPALRQKVREVYSEAATNPNGKLPFPIGRSFAEQVGYPKTLLDSLPDIARTLVVRMRRLLLDNEPYVIGLVDAK